MQDHNDHGLSLTK